MNTIEVLIKSAQKGNNKAFRKLVEHYDEKIFGLISRYAGHTELAKDIYQEVFFNVYKNLKSFTFKSDFYTWLYRITVNTALTAIQKEKKHLTVDIENSSASVLFNEDKFLLAEILEEAKSLPEKQRIVFFMRFQNDLKISEISDALNVDSGTVKGYLSRSIKRIRERLEIL